MAPPRFITCFTLDNTCNQLKLTVDTGGTPKVTTITIPAATYYHADDNAADDIIDVIQDLANAATYVPAAGGQDWVMGVVGVSTDAAELYGAGRVAIGEEGIGTGFELDFDISNGLDPRVLGYPAGSTQVTSIVSTYAHLYGWYPERIPTVQDKRPALRRHVEYSEFGTVDDAKWGEFDLLNVVFQEVIAARCATVDAADSTHAASALLTAGDVHAPLDVWALDCDSVNKWRYYPDREEATYWGPFRFGPGSQMWTDPLGPPTVLRPGKRRIIPITAYEAVG